MFKNFFWKKTKTNTISSDVFFWDNKKVEIKTKNVKNLSAKILKDSTISVNLPQNINIQKVWDFLDKKKNIIEKYIKKNNSLQEKKQEFWDKIMLFWDFYNFVKIDKVWKKNTQKEFLDIVWDTIYSFYDLKNQEILLYWYKIVAKNTFSIKIQELAEKHWFNYKKLFVRSQKTKRWVCSGKNNIWLNRKLIKCPKYVSEYVIIHELCHTVHHDHSKNFWNLVQNTYPDFKNAKKWLKENWNLL